MSKFTQFKFSAALALVALTSLAAPAAASTTLDLSNPAFAAVSGLTSIPIGHAKFCQTRPTECTVNTNIQDAVKLTQNRWQELLEVNTRLNAAIVPVTDKELYGVEEFWTYPQGFGDCEDYALAKRQELIKRGWNPSTLLITVLVSPKIGGHAVLMVRTDRGDLILDNLQGLIKVWNQTPYKYIKRQSQSNAGQWVDIVDPRPAALIASL
ncbi:hypothetical protein MNBD_ALPHA12-168 [hydrothermal vent metagenome]|uniref:COGs COG3672 n=1 Tax=hydrothermal vent metagenome TaxID=652676 RepID=A0A3B0U7D5_9ZZZZ